MGITEGRHATADLHVSEADTAITLGSGDVPVLATPRVLALAEAATVAVVSGALDEGRTTVGTAVSLAHTAATAVGALVRAEALLRQVEGNRLVFDVSVTEQGATIAHGTVERVIVHRERFLAAAEGRG